MTTQEMLLEIHNLRLKIAKEDSPLRISELIISLIIAYDLYVRAIGAEDMGQKAA